MGAKASESFLPGVLNAQLSSHKGKADWLNICTMMDLGEQAGHGMCSLTSIMFIFHNCAKPFSKHILIQI